MDEVFEQVLWQCVMSGTSIQDHIITQPPKGVLADFRRLLYISPASRPKMLHPMFHGYVLSAFRASPHRFEALGSFCCARVRCGGKECTDTHGSAGRRPVTAVWRHMILEELLDGFITINPAFYHSKLSYNALGFPESPV